MKERTEKVIPLGFIRSTKKVVDEIEKTSSQMQQQGWHYLNTRTDEDLNIVTLTFEREINE